jgi:hypothetical protein
VHFQFARTETEDAAGSESERAQAKGNIMKETSQVNTASLRRFEIHSGASLGLKEFMIYTIHQTEMRKITKNNLETADVFIPYRIMI